MTLIDVKGEMNPMDFLAQMTMQPEILTKLGPARADMVLAEAKHRMWGCPRDGLLAVIVGVENAQLFDFRLDMTVWELQLGKELSDLYREDCQKMSSANLKAVKMRKLKAKKMEVGGAIGVEEARKRLANSKQL